MRRFNIDNIFRNIIFTKDAKGGKGKILADSSCQITLETGTEKSNEIYKWKKNSDGTMILKVFQNNDNCVFNILSSLSNVMIIQFADGNITYYHPSADSVLDLEITFSSPGPGVYMDSSYPDIKLNALYWQRRSASDGRNMDLMNVYDKRLVNIGIVSNDSYYSYSADASFMDTDETTPIKAVNLTGDYDVLVDDSNRPIRNIQIDTMNYVNYQDRSVGTGGYDYQPGNKELDMYTNDYNTFRFIGSGVVSIPRSTFPYQIVDMKGKTTEYTGDEEVTITVNS
jgi:hypothetical protein